MSTTLPTPPPPIAGLATIIAPPVSETPHDPYVITQAPPLKPIRRVTHLDLPDTDNLPLENTIQSHQMALLTDALIAYMDTQRPNETYQIGQDMGIYYRLTNPPLNGCRSPDWTFISNVPRLVEGIRRRSYVMWDEGIRPLIVMEFVSEDGQVEHDDTPFTGKFWVYRHCIGAAYYVIHDVFQETLEVYQLVGQDYQLVSPNEHGHYLLPGMQLCVGHWRGTYRGDDGLWVRFYTTTGEMLPVPAETNLQLLEDNERERLHRLAAEQRERLNFAQFQAEKQRAEAEKQRAEAAEKRLAELLQQLKQQGIPHE